MRKRRKWGEAYEWLANHLEADALREFVRLYGGSLMRVPSYLRESRRQRTERVLRDLQHNATYDEVAEAAGVSRSTAIRYANSPTDVPR